MGLLLSQRLGHLVSYLLFHLGWLVAAGVFCYGLGWRLLGKLRFHSTCEAAAFCTAAGLGVTSHLLMLLGLSGHLDRPALLVCLGALACVLPYRGAARWLLRHRAQLSRWAVIGGVALLLTTPLWALALYPPTQFDATMYHLTLARTYAGTHHIAPVQEVRFSVFPQLNEVLFTAALLLFDDVAAQLLQFLMTAVLALGIYAHGSRLSSAHAGLLGAALWLGTPLAVWLGTSAYIDTGLALYCALATFAMLTALRTADHGFVGLAGLMGGFAASSKYLGLFFLALLGLCSLYLSRRERRWSFALVYTLTGALAGAPWYAYNLWHTSNPVFPFLGQLFGYSYWNAEDLRAQMEEMRSHGVGRGLGALLLLPINLTVRAQRFGAEAPLSPLYLAGLLMLVPALQRRSAQGSPWGRGLGWVILAYALFWFGTMHIVRYLMPVMPLLSVMIAVAAYAGGPWSRWLLRPLVQRAVLLMALLPSVAMGVYLMVRRGLPPTTPAAREAFLSRENLVYPALSYLNQRARRGYRAYGLSTEEMSYFAAGGVLLGDHFGFARYARIIPKLGDGAALRRELDDMNIDHLLLRAEQSLPAAQAQAGRLYVVLTTPSLVLYELR